MATSTLAQKYTINGVVNTDNPVMDNLEQLSRSAGSFITYDVHTGQWAVVINAATSSVKSFNNSNILGPINVSTTDLFSLYNGVEVEFPLLDTADKTDYVRIATPGADRSVNEPNNTFKMSLSFCSEPVQAYVLGNIELQQARLDQVVTFQTDFSALDLNAGQVIDLTNDLYQFDQKQFRIITIREIDGDNGDLSCEITALEYDANIYTAGTVPRSVRTDLTGIQTLGAMTAPTVSFELFESSARPQINVVSTVPTGVIEGVECWLSMDATNYVLRQTIKSEETTLVPGSNIKFEFDDVAAGTVYAKTRGTNFSVSGPFSTVATTTYTPVQITNAMDENTSLIENGLPLSLLLTLPELLASLDSFLDGNDNIADQLAGLGFMVVATVGSAQNVLVSTNIVNDGTRQVITFSNFVPVYTGQYKLDVIVDQNSSGALGGRGSSWSEDLDYVSMEAIVDDITDPAAPVRKFGEASGGQGAFSWTDYAMTGTMNLTAGVTYQLAFSSNIYTESNLGAQADITVGWVIYSVS